MGQRGPERPTDAQRCDPTHPAHAGPPAAIAPAGQRDPSKLHKDDPRRYRSKFKTRSAKSKRVGQEAKARREREQQA